MIIPSWALGVSVIIFASMVAKLILAKMRAATPVLPASDAELGEMRQALEETQQRLGEVEERLDFAERLLAAHRDGIIPPAGGSPAA